MAEILPTRRKTLSNQSINPIETYDQLLIYTKYMKELQRYWFHVILRLFSKSHLIRVPPS